MFLSFYCFTRIRYGLLGQRNDYEMPNMQQWPKWIVSGICKCFEFYDTEYGSFFFSFSGQLCPKING